MAIRAVKHSWGGGKGVRYELNRAESSRIRPVGARWRQKRFKGKAEEGTAASRARARPGRRGAAGTPPHAFAYRR